MGSTQAAAARHQQKVDELCAASIRAVSGDAALHFRGRRLFRDRRVLPVHAAHLHPSPERDDFSSFRGAADGMALRIRLSDAALHKRLCPVDPIARMVFELLEQIRVESLAPAEMIGLVRNLRHRHEQWSLAFHESGLTETAKGILLYTVAQVCRARVTAQPVVDATEGVIEATRMALAPLLGHDLAGLRRQRNDQSAYAQHALAIAGAVAQAIHEAQAGDDESDTSGDDDGEADRKLFSLWMDVDAEPDDGVAAASSGHSRVLDEADDGYRVFTTAYDVEVKAATLVRVALLKEYRERLDRRIVGQGINIARLARQLKAALAVPARNEWEGSQEEGSIDGRRLSQLIASPTERRLFRIERQELAADCVVGFLIDCSGSMKQHIESVAMLVDVFARALEQAGVCSEVLGFTTGAWNGGRALRDWQRARRPAHPGRLNEACHMVFKEADTPWRRARPDIAALLKSDLFREGIDGEAVDWACARLQGRSEGRRLLIVISDGSPMDSATQLANDAHYLDHHLREVVARHEQQGAVEICGVGVGLDLSPYYRRSRVIDLSAGLRNEVFHEIVAMIPR
ncbi:cobalt chelatase [Variovorax sp. J22R133]|uniref:cobaltochelatase CobT-related protein n=1 Tax=Variovorax brevis TaxID=3053503 RepID=UPI0025777ECB|nr:cobalt chelatase [Variovorax sp. J22R133]MDM0111601.1 cobalt chelatase [Variovorax sp. J22R133]